MTAARWHRQRLPAVCVQPCTGHHGLREWQVCYRLSAPARPHGWLKSLLILEASALQLFGVRIGHGENTVFEINSHRDGHGRLCTAGDIVQGMAAMSGHVGLRIDGRDLSGPAALNTELQVHLRLHSPDAETARRTQVHAELEGEAPLA